MSVILLSPIQAPAILDIAKSLTPAGFDLVIANPGTPEFYQAAADAEYFLGSTRQMGGEFFRSAPKLRLVQLTSAGYWRAADSPETRVYELAGRTLGIVGLGNIGKKVARRAAAFDMRVQYYDIARLTLDQEDAIGVRFALFTELLQTSDVVSLHVPLDDSTRKMIGARELGLMKPTAVLVNTCRGPVIDEDALYLSLKERKIAGAGLDVLVDEPPAKTHPVFSLPNVTLTPHSAGPTWENWTARYRNGFDNIQRVASGARPRWVIPELA